MCADGPVGELCVSSVYGSNVSACRLFVDGCGIVTAPVGLAGDQLEMAPLGGTTTQSPQSADAHQI